MARKRYKPEEIVSLLRQAEVLHGQGMSMAGRDPAARDQRGQLLPLANRTAAGEIRANSLGRRRLLCSCRLAIKRIGCLRTKRWCPEQCRWDE